MALLRNSLLNRGAESSGKRGNEAEGLGIAEQIQMYALLP